VKTSLLFAAALAILGLAADPVIAQNIKPMDKTSEAILALKPVTTGLQKVSDQLELSKPAPQMVDITHSGRPLLQMASNGVTSCAWHGSIHRNSTASDLRHSLHRFAQWLTDFANPMRTFVGLCRLQR
jgi:hypothetical protein